MLVVIDIQPGDIVSTLEGAQAQEESNQELIANQMGNNEGPNGERNQGSQHDSKGIVFICINNGNGGNVPPVTPSIVWSAFYKYQKVAFYLQANYRFD